MQTPTRTDSSQTLLSVRVGPSARAVITTRFQPGGVESEDFNLAFHVGDDPAKIARNRDRLAAWLAEHEGVTAPIRWMNQVHSAIAARIPGDGLGERAGEESAAEEPPTADALVWNRRADQAAASAGTEHLPSPAACNDDVLDLEVAALSARSQATGALAVMTADCVPLLFASSDGQVLAAVHAGRVGMLAGIVSATLEAFAEAGVPASDIWALLGPSISGENYELPEEMVAEAATQEPNTRAVTRQGTAGLDVAAGVVAQLERAGVRHIERLPICTWEDERFFSYRREGQTGRMACVIFPAHR